MEEKKRKSVDSKWIIWCCVALVVMYLITCPMTRANIFETTAGKCISISLFGKLELRGVDKVVITIEDGQTTITEQKLIKQITDETKIATHVRSHCGGAGKCEIPHGKIDLYREDKLVRSMEWYTCCDMVNVYEENSTHWLITWVSRSHYGYVYLSDELVERLNALAGI